MSTLTHSAARVGLITLIGLAAVACSSPGTLPPSPTAASATQLPTSVPSSTPAPTNTPAPPTLAASRTPPPTPIPATVAPLPSATLNAWRFLPACGEATTTISLSALPTATSQPGWKLYTQPDYGLSVDVPPDWRLAVGPHALCLAPTAAPSVILTIGFRGSIESAAIDRIAINAGELITHGSVIVLDRPVRRSVLVYQDQDKAILYNGFGEMSTPYLALTASLDDFSSDYEAVALSPSLQTTADQIVASLVSTSPSTTWQPYTSPTFDVNVQYPSNWKLDSSGNAIFSGPDGFFQISASESLGLSAVAFCQETLHNIETLDPAKPDLMGLGRHPAMETLSVDEQPACILTPSDDQAPEYRAAASLYVDYPTALRPRGLFMIWADKVHVRELADRLTFVRTP